MTRCAPHRAPVVGVSPIIGGAPVRGHGRRVPDRARGGDVGPAVAEHYGARSAGGLLDGWLVDDADADAVAAVRAAGIAARALPLLMSDGPATAAIARAALDLGDALRSRTPTQPR